MHFSKVSFRFWQHIIPQNLTNFFIHCTRDNRFRKIILRNDSTRYANLSCEHWVNRNAPAMGKGNVIHLVHMARTVEKIDKALLPILRQLPASLRQQSVTFQRTIGFPEAFPCRIVPSVIDRRTLRHIETMPLS